MAKKVKSFKNFNIDHIKSRVSDMIRLIDASPVYNNMSVEDIISRIDSSNYFSSGKLGDKEKEILKETLKKRRESLSKKVDDDDDIVYWDDLLDEMKNDFGQFTNISKSDFNYISNWIKNKIGRKNIHI